MNTKPNPPAPGAPAPLDDHNPLNLGSSPPVDDVAALGAYLQDLVKHGHDPTPWIGRFRALLADAPNRPLFVEFLSSVEDYLAGVAEGSVHCESLKQRVEEFRLEPEGAGTPGKAHPSGELDRPGDA